MNRVAHPVPPDEEALDALLGAFFKAEMPVSWPAFQPPRPRVLPFRPAAPARKRPGYFLSSRVVLAASVALLLLGAWLMPRAPFSAAVPGPKYNADSGGADPRKRGFTQPIPDVFPKDLFPTPDEEKKGAEKDAENKVKSSLRLEQKDGRGAIRIDVEELPPDK